MRKYAPIDNYGYYKQEDSLTILFTPRYSLPEIIDVKLKNEIEKNDTTTTVLIYDNIGKKINLNSIGIKINTTKGETKFYYQKSFEGKYLDGKISIPNSDLDGGFIELVGSFHKANYGKINLKKGKTNIITLNTSVYIYNKVNLFHFTPRFLYGEKNEGTLIVDSILNADRTYFKDTLIYSEKTRFTKHMKSNIRLKFNPVYWVSPGTYKDKLYPKGFKIDF